jgi:hypothetical protein
MARGYKVSGQDYRMNISGNSRSANAGPLDGIMRFESDVIINYFG